MSIAHKLGTAEIRTLPERGVALSTVDRDSVLALGVTPVGTYNPPLRGWPAAWIPPGPPSCQLAMDVPIEKIAALEPDLIVPPGMWVWRLLQSLSAVQRKRYFMVDPETIACAAVSNRSESPRGQLDERAPAFAAVADV